MRSLQGRNTMTSQPMRDQVEDHLITRKDSALLIIDYQPPQVSSIVSMDHRTLVANIVATARLAKVFALPIVLSTVNVKTGLSTPTIHQLAEVLAGIEELDRTSINAWEDEEFVTAVKATCRKKLIMTALWTDACLAFPALDALREGYEVYPVVDTVGGTSPEAPRAGLERIVQAGAQPISLGVPGVRASAGLGSPGDRPGHRGHRPQLPAARAVPQRGPRVVPPRRCGAGRGTRAPPSPARRNPSFGAAGCFFRSAQAGLGGRQQRRAPRRAPRRPGPHQPPGRGAPVPFHLHGG